MPCLDTYIAVLDTAIEIKLLLALTERQEYTSDLLNLLRLPARLGGIASPSFLRLGKSELARSREVESNQVQSIFRQNDDDWQPITAVKFWDEA